MSLKMIGLKNCDTCRKAQKWLQNQNIEYSYQDVRDDGLSADDIAFLIEQTELDKVVNRRSTTWRQLDEDIKTGLNEENAIAVIKDNPTLLKRPVFIDQTRVIIGFGPQEQKDLLDR